MKILDRGGLHIELDPRDWALLFEVIWHKDSPIVFVSFLCITISWGWRNEA